MAAPRAVAPRVTPHVRRASPADADELARLRWDFRVEHGTPVRGTFETFTEEFRAFASDVLVDGSPWRAWVAEDGERLVGCAWLQLVEKIPHPNRARWERPVAYVTNMYVEPAFRNLGLGRSMLDVVIQDARAIGVDGLLLWPSERSVPFYRRGGFGSEGWLWLRVEGD